MTNTLREKVARAMCVADHYDPDELNFDEEPNWKSYLHMADAILAIPEIAEALRAHEHWSEGVELPPELIEKMRLVYGSPAKMIRVTDE